MEPSARQHASTPDDGRRDDGASALADVSEVAGARRSAWRELAVVVCGSVAAGAAVRLWLLRGRVPLEWNDSADFVASSRAPWLSWDLWAGERPVATPLLLKLVGRDFDVYVAAQALLAALCWAALATAVWSVVGGRRARRLAAGVLLAFSMTVPVVMWERSVLTESLAISLLALVVAAVVRLARGVTWWRAAALLGALVPWLATRDTHAAVAAMGGAAVTGAPAIAWVRSRLRSRGVPPRPSDGQSSPPSPPRHQRPGPLVAVAAGSVALALLAGLGASHGRRHAFPLRNVFEVRVLPYPDRVRWFAAHGMPQAEVFLGEDARPAYVEAGQAPVVFVADDDPELGRWLAWIEDDARVTFALWAATHPGYLVTEPLRAPERTFNNAHGDRSFYRPLDMRRVALVDRVLALPTVTVLFVAAAVGGWAIGRRRGSPALVAGAITAALAVPHGLSAWHGDGMETARHLVVPALQFHVGVLLMVLGTLRPAGEDDGDAGRPGQRSGKSSSRLGWSRPPSASTTLPVT
jgi:hypothetical protein